MDVSGASVVVVLVAVGRINVVACGGHIKKVVEVSRGWWWWGQWGSSQFDWLGIAKFVETLTSCDFVDMLNVSTFFLVLWTFPHTFYFYLMTCFFLSIFTFYFYFWIRWVISQDIITHCLCYDFEELSLIPNSCSVVRLFGRWAQRVPMVIHHWFILEFEAKSEFNKKVIWL